MKTLVESLFDRDLIKRTLTFGDVFELQQDDDPSHLFREVGSMSWSNYLSNVRIKKDTKISGATPNETIFKGLLKLITDIKFTEDNMTTDLFEDYLTDMLHPYYQWSLGGKYKHAYVQVYKNGSFLIGQERDMLTDDFDTIQIFPCQTLCMTFKRK